MWGERWALVLVKLALLFLRTCSRRPIFARLFSCAECTCVRSRRPVYMHSFSPACVRVLALTPGTSHSPRARCSRSCFSRAGSSGPRFLRAGPSQPRFSRVGSSGPRFSRAGPFGASLFVRWPFAALLFTRWHFCGLALHALALHGLAFHALALLRPRFTRAGTLRPCFSRAGSFAASLFARWLLHGLAFRALAFRTSAVSANLDLHDFGLGELSAPQTPTTPSNSSSLALRALPLHALVLRARLRRPTFARLFSTRWMELHSGVQGLRAGHVVEIFRQGIPDGLVEGFVDSKKILGRDSSPSPCVDYHTLFTPFSH